MRSESEIQNEIIHYLTTLQPKIVFWRNNVGGLKDINGRIVRFGLKGSADIIGIISPNGKFLAIECKTEKGKQRPEQIAFEKMINKMGGIYILARSVEDVKKELDNLKNK